MRPAFCQRTRKLSLLKPHSEFRPPASAERLEYAKYWQSKLDNASRIRFEDTLVNDVAERTEGFSFAYLKEIL